LQCTPPVNIRESYAIVMHICNRQKKCVHFPESWPYG
jgi:hypothetical protein